MSFERRERHIIREINLVPLIDVLLVVLFFYMIISPMMSRGLDVNLPRSESNTGRKVLSCSRSPRGAFVEKSVSISG
jgi:biopolymer transport protein TolR